MQLDHERFGRDGFLILRGFLEPDELHELRLGFDVLVQLSQEQSRRERTPDQPIGGAWQAAAQPRVKVDDLVTAETAHVAGWVIGKPLGVSTELLGAKRAGIGSLELMGYCGIESLEGLPIEEIHFQDGDGYSLRIENNDGLSQDILDAYVAGVSVTGKGSVEAIAAEDGACATWQNARWKSESAWCSE